MLIKPVRTEEQYWDIWIQDAKINGNRRGADMETLYWIGEYSKVFCCYMFFVFVWPSVVFSRHLRHKDKIYRFGFCVLVQVIIANSVVLGLGLLHILNSWVVCGIFYGIFFLNIAAKLDFHYRKGMFGEVISSGRRLIMGTSGIKLFLYQRFKTIGIWLKGVIVRVWNILCSHLMEYALLFVILVYGIIYFSYGVFQDYNYGFGDMYVHHEWINELVNGNIFGKGVYPEAMHCFIYCLHVLFGLKVYNCMLFLAGIYIVVFLISVYCFFREVFEWRYTPFFVLIIFLVLDLMCIQEVFGMSRLQWTIPQEFGLYTQYLCALFLLRYLKNSRKRAFLKKFEKFVWNEDLFLFMMALAASITIHFYNTIMAFFMCVPLGIFFIGRILKRERVVPVAAAILCGIFIAAAPMGAALASGIPFQGSIDWALGIVSGDEAGEEGVKNKDIIDKVDIQDGDKALGERLKDTLSVLYWRGYVTLYKEKRADVLIRLTGLAAVLWLIYHAIRVACRLVKKKWPGKSYFSGYMPIIMTSVLLMVVYVSPWLGLPQLIADSRICTTEHVLLIAVVAIPADMLFTLVSRICPDVILQGMSVITAAGTLGFIIATGKYHGYLYCELSRYNAAINVTDSIMNKFPKYSYTIVSTTEELYHVVNSGRHEELLTFIQEMDKRDYKLPTEYIFLYVEKRPIEYGQSHYFSGPAWLASEKYVDFYADFASQCPKINASEISEEAAQKEVELYERPSKSYSILESRTILESKAYLWCKNFSKIHPFEVNVYYEDEDFVCFFFRQNPYALYDLAIDDWDRTDGVQWEN